MPDAHKNFAVSAVAIAPVPAASGTSLTVTAGHGTRFPSVPFNATVWPDGFQPDPSNAEIVRVTNIVGSVLTIQRAQEGSSARAILVGDQIAATITAKTLTDAEEGVQSLAASNTTYTSGTVSITGVGGGVTVSSNTGQRIDISVAAPVAQSVQPETQTFVGGISASDALYTSGTVRVTGVGGGVTVSSNTGQRVDISVAAPVAQTVQTQNAVDVTLAGNTAGALALVSSGTMTLAGGNNVTLSQAGNAVTISAGAGGAATAISGIGNSQTTYTSGTVNLSVVAGNLTIRSTTGQAFQFSASQTVQAETQTFVGGVVASNATYTSGTVTLTGVGGGVTVSSNTGQRVDISVAAQSVQTQDVLSVGASTGGNTLGNTGVNTGSRLVFVGSNNITVSQGTAAGATTLTISGPSVAGAQTGISGIANSQTTYTSGTVSLSELGAVTIRSTTGQIYQVSVNSQTNQTGSVYASSNTFGTSSGSYDARSISIAGSGAVSVAASNSGWVVSAPAQTTQTQGILSAGVSTGGNTSGNTQVSTGSRLVFVGSNNITISQGTAAGATTLTISGPSVAGAQTGISGFANSQTTYTSGTVSLSELGAITIRSTTGQQFQLSVNAQSVQPETQTFLAGAAASNTTYTSGTFTVTGVGGGVTVNSNTGQRIDISVASPVAQTNQSGNVYASSNTFGTSSGTYDARSLSIAGSGNVSIAASNSGWVVSVPAQTVQTQGILSAGVSTGGNTAGNTQVSTGSRFVIVGSGNITASQGTAAGATTVTLSVAAGAAQTAISGLANSQTTYTSGTVSLSELGAITIRSTTGNQFQLSVNAQTVQPETQTFVGGVANSQTTYTSGTVSLSELGAITIRSTTGNQYQLSVNAQTTQTQGILSAGVSTGGNTAGNTTVNTGSRLVFVGTNMVSLSQTTGAGATTVSINATQSVQPETQTFLGAIQNSQTTYTSGTVNLSVVAGNLTIRSTTGQAFQFSASQSVQAETQTFVGGIANSQTTYTSGTVSWSELGAVTVRSTTGQQFQISVNSQSVQTQGILNVALSTGGNTLGDTGLNSGTRLVLAGGNNITLSGSSAANASTITIIGPTPGAAQYSVGVSTGGNTTGNTGVSGTRIVLAGQNMVTLSQATDATGATISVNATQSVQTQGVPALGISTGGATSGDTGVASGTRFVLVGTNLTMSQGTAANATTVTVSAPATSSLSATGGIEISTNGSTISIGYGNNLADWQNMPNLQASLLTHVSGISKTPFYWNDHLDGDLTAKSLALKISMVTASQPLSVSVHLGVYTFVNSTSANRLASHSEAFVVSSASSVSLSGVRNLILTGIGTHATLSTISAGEYLLGLMFSATATNAMNFSLYGAGVGGGGGGALGGLFPGTNNMSTGTSQGIQVLQGRGSTTVNAFPSAVSAADLVNQGSGASAPLHPWIYIRS